MALWRRRLTKRQRRWVLAYWLIVLPLAFIAGWIWGYPHTWIDLPSLASFPWVPPPPDRLNRLAAEGIQHVAPYLYWALFIFHLVIWEILRWQRNVPESGAARWFRRFLLAKSFLWLTLAVGRTLLQEWLIVGYAAIVLYISIATGAAMIALIWTYIVPIYRCRNGRCEPELAPPISEVTYPISWSPTRDGERRKNLKDRRRIPWP